MAPSSSGLGLLVLIQAIAGSNPAGVTKNQKSAPEGASLVVGLYSYLTLPVVVGMAEIQS